MGDKLLLEILDYEIKDYTAWRKELFKTDYSCRNIELMQNQTQTLNLRNP